MSSSPGHRRPVRPRPQLRLCLEPAGRPSRLRRHRRRPRRARVALLRLPRERPGRARPAGGADLDPSVLRRGRRARLPELARDRGRARPAQGLRHAAVPPVRVLQAARHRAQVDRRMEGRRRRQGLQGRGRVLQRARGGFGSVGQARQAERGGAGAQGRGASPFLLSLPLGETSVSVQCASCG